MLNIETIKKNIIKKLKPLNPKEVILFGSYAYGQPTKESDIDLYVVTKDDFLPASFQENIEVKKKFIQALYELESDISFDIIVHTKAMNQKFKSLNSYFSRKIYSDGEILYAKY